MAAALLALLQFLLLAGLLAALLVVPFKLLDYLADDELVERANGRGSPGAEDDGRRRTAGRELPHRTDEDVVACTHCGARNERGFDYCRECAGAIAG